MIELLKTIVKAVEAIFNGIVYCFTMAPKLLLTIGASMDRITLLFSGLPPFLAYVFAIVLVCAVVFLILKIFHG